MILQIKNKLKQKYIKNSVLNNAVKGGIANCDSPFPHRQFLFPKETKAAIVFFILLIQREGNYHGSELYRFQRMGIWESFWGQLLFKKKVIIKPKI